MSATNLDASDLHLANLDGVINESVLQAIFDISNVELPFTQRAASGSHDNQYHSWRMDKLADPVIDGQLIDGQVVTTETNATKASTLKSMGAGLRYPPGQWRWTQLRMQMKMHTRFPGATSKFADQLRPQCFPTMPQCVAPQLLQV